MDWLHVRCNSCSHRYVNPMPGDSDIARMYDRSYFAPGGAWVCGFWQGGYEENEDRLRAEARGALRQLPVASGRLLEIGPAGGFFLDEARSAGFDVVGVEINPEMAEYGRTRLQLDIRTGMFEDASLPSESFDVIVMQDVLEHVRQPRTFLAAASQLLKPGGYVFLRGPLEESWRERFYHTLRKFGRRGLRVVDEPPFHLQGFSRKSLIASMTSAGMDVQTLTASAFPPTLSLHDGPKAVLASAIETIAFRLDQISGGGDFVVAVGRKKSS